MSSQKQQTGETFKLEQASQNVSNARKARRVARAAREKQHRRGKMTARERVEFVLARRIFSGVRTSWSSIVRRIFRMRQGIIPGERRTGLTDDGRKVLSCPGPHCSLVVPSENHAEKICKVMDLAMKAAPRSSANDSGARAYMKAYQPRRYGIFFWPQPLASGVVPQTSCIMGRARAAPFTVGVTDFNIMVKTRPTVHHRRT